MKYIFDGPIGRCPIENIQITYENESGIYIDEDLYDVDAVSGDSFALEDIIMSLQNEDNIDDKCKTRVFINLEDKRKYELVLKKVEGD